MSGAPPTNGSICVLVAEAWPEAQPCDTNKGKRFAGWFDGHEPMPVDLSALARFANYGAGLRDCQACDNKRTQECDDCDGTGEVTCECEHGYDHEHDCDECDGDGTVECEDCSDLTVRRPARLLDHVINRQVLRVVLETLGISEGAARISRNDKKLYLLTPDTPEPAWMVVFMPLADGIGDDGVIFDRPETWEKPVAA